MARYDSKRGMHGMRAARALSVVALAGALAVAGWPMVSDMAANADYERQFVQAMEDARHFDSAEVEAQLVKAVDYNAMLAGDQGFPMGSADYDVQLDLQGDALAWLEIPRLGLKLPVYKGSGTDGEVEARLLEGAVHVPETSLPIGGASTHAAITAHTGVSHSAMFDNLGKLEPTDRFSLFVMGSELVYEVYDVDVVLPEEAPGALGVEEGEDLVTLITCTPYGVNDHRILVHARRVAESVEADAPQVLDAAQPDSGKVAGTAKAEASPASDSPGKAAKASKSALPKTGDLLTSPRVLLFAGAAVVVATIAIAFALAALRRQKGSN